MKDYKELIQTWQKIYNDKLKYDIYEIETRREVSIHNLHFISNLMTDIIKEYCNYFIIAGECVNKIRITLIINK